MEMEQKMITNKDALEDFNAWDLYEKNGNPFPMKQTTKDAIRKALQAQNFNAKEIYWKTRYFLLRAKTNKKQPDFDNCIGKMTNAYEEERAKYVGGVVYYPNNQAAFEGCMKKAIEKADGKE